MSATRTQSNDRLKSLFWLSMAALCIVFSGAFKKLMEQRANPTYYYSASSLDKKVKDGCRDRHEYRATVMHADAHHAPDYAIADICYLSSLFSFAFLLFSHRVAKPENLTEQRVAFASAFPLYLRDRRLEV